MSPSEETTRAVTPVVPASIARMLTGHFPSAGFGSPRSGPDPNRVWPMQDTSGADYAARLHALQGKRWKRLLNVQAPYQWNLRRRHLGRTLEIGCGIGRNLASLGAGS